jgi:dihydroorotase/N-acyl-D-amino-acid deacylase
MFTKLFLVISLIIMMMSFVIPTTSSQSTQFDVVIKNGRIIDGSGRPGYNADLAIKGQRIVEIGNLGSATATRTIDANGLVVAPGFIDMLGQSETYLLIDPRGMSKVMMGVTTEITGEGESVAPINDRQIKEQEDFLKRFNLTIDWRTLDEYFKRLEKQRTGLNLGTVCWRNANSRIRGWLRQPSPDARPNSRR